MSTALAQLQMLQGFVVREQSDTFSPLLLLSSFSSVYGAKPEKSQVLPFHPVASQCSELPSRVATIQPQGLLGPSYSAVFPNCLSPFTHGLGCHGEWLLTTDAVAGPHLPDSPVS